MELPQDQSLFVKFYTVSVVNQAKSYGEKGINFETNAVVWEIQGAGRPVSEDHEYVTIVVPGDKDSIVERRALFCGSEGECRAAIPERCDVHRFPRQYAAYKAGKAEHQEGTDLKTWPGVTRSQAEELAYLKVYTVEQLATMLDSNAGMFVREREKARAYLEAAKKQVSADQMKRELDERDEKLRKMEAQIAALTAAQEKSEKGKPLSK